jgi:serine/threonine protein kinase
MFRFGRTGTVPYSAPEVTRVSAFHMTLNSTTADIWSWGAVLYRMTYNVSPDHNYTPPCYRPPADQPPARDPHLLSVLRHTLVLHPKERPDALWLSRHPYTKTS